MDLADYIGHNRDRLIETWNGIVVGRLGLDLEQSELRDSLPALLDALASGLRSPSALAMISIPARSHGRARLRVGVDAVGVIEEIAMVEEALWQICEEDSVDFAWVDLRAFGSLVRQTMTNSVGAYLRTIDQLRKQQIRASYEAHVHSIRTPLQTAKLSAALVSATDRASSDAHLLRLRKALGRMADLLNASTEQLGLPEKATIVLETWSAEQIVREAVSDKEPLAQARDNTIRLDVAPFSMRVHGPSLVAALSHLVDNALKFTDSGHVTVRAWTSESRALFEVKDECGGMPEEQPARLLSLTEGAVDEELPAKAVGGFGLRVAKSAAMAHDGTLRIANRPGKGCSFVLDVPLRQDT